MVTIIAANCFVHTVANLEFVDATKGREDESPEIRRRFLRVISSKRQIATIRDRLDGCNKRSRGEFKFNGAELEASGDKQQYHSVRGAACLRLKPKKETYGRYGASEVGNYVAIARTRFSLPQIRLR